jgi:hypothetical protein
MDNDHKNTTGQQKNSKTQVFMEVRLTTEINDAG